MKQPKSNQGDDKDRRPQTRSLEDQEDALGAESSIVIPNVNTGLPTAVSDNCTKDKPRVKAGGVDESGLTNTASACESLVVDRMNQEPVLVELQQMVQDELQFAMGIASTHNDSSSENHNQIVTGASQRQFRLNSVSGIPGAHAVYPSPDFNDADDTRSDIENRPSSDESPTIYAELVGEEEISISSRDQVQPAELVTDATLVIPIWKKKRFWCALLLAVASIISLAILLGGIFIYVFSSPPSEVTPTPISVSDEDIQRQSLMDFYQASGGTKWHVSTGWSEIDDGGKNNEQDSVCTWHGVVCDFGRRYVMELILPDNNLTGDLGVMIQPLLDGVSSLTRLDLRANKIAGNMTAVSMEIAEMGDHLVDMDFLMNSMLTGHVPWDVCGSLVQVDYNEEGKNNTDIATSALESFSFLVDCSVSCDCCNHEVLCSSCVDIPGWQDDNGRGCEWYKDNLSKCTDAVDVPSISTKTIDKSGAQVACCVCNGGNIVHPARPSLMPSSSPTWQPTASTQPSSMYEDQFVALTALYEATNGGEWTNITNWFEASSVCDWHGILCDDGNEDHLVVRKILLNENNLDGTLPSEVGLLNKLQSLELSQNSISGTLPTEIGQMTSLQLLWLSYNYLEGTIPSEIGQIPSLEIFYISHTDYRLSGSIPSEIGMLSELRHLFVAYNDISGTLPSELGQLKKLERIWASSNRLDGQIPVQLGSLQLIKALSFNDNYLSGIIPSELGLLKEMEQLYLGLNDFAGVSMPDEVCALREIGKLELLWADCNNLMECSCCTLCLS